MLGKDLLADHLKNEGSKAETKPEKISKLVTQWKAVMAERYDFQFIPTLKQRCLLKLLYNKLGLDTSAVMVWSIRNWTKVIHNVNGNHGLYGGPAKPDPAYLLAHADTARATWSTYVALPPPPTPTKIDKTHLYVKEVKASKEEVEKIMKEIGLMQ